MSSMNFFNSLPTEILENEILPWLSPPGAAALILAAGLTVPKCKLPVIWIYWKHLHYYSQREITLTIGSRDPCDARVIESLGHDRKCTNPEDRTYIYHASGLWDDTYFTWTVDRYVIVKAMTDVNPQSLHAVYHGELSTKIETIGELKRGQVPEGDASLKKFVGRWSVMYVNEEALMKYVCRGIGSTITLADACKFLERYFNAHPITLESTCEWAASNELAITDTWFRVTPAMFTRALTLGHIWFLRDILNFEQFSDDQWAELVADFSPRIAAGGTRPRPTTLICNLERLSAQVLLYGDGAVFNACILTGSVTSMARELRRILGDARMRELAEAHDFKGVLLYIWSGAPYHAFQYDSKNHLSEAHHAIRCNNAEYLRGLITDNPDFAHTYQCVIYGECITRGQIDCVRVVQERWL